MNRKIIVSVLLVSILFVNSIAGTMLLILVFADSNEPVTFSSGLTLYSPVNTTYSSNVVECNGTFNWPKPYQLSLNYCIDGEDQGALLWSIDANTISIPEYTTMSGSFQLPQLSNGPHQLSIGIDEEWFNNTGTTRELISKTTWVNPVYFTIASSQPTPTLSPTTTPNIPEISWLVILPLFISAFLVAVKLKNQKNR